MMTRRIGILMSPLKGGSQFSKFTLNRISQQNNYLSLQRGGSERCMSLHNLHEQGNPLWGTEGSTHVWCERNAPHEAQRAPAPVLFPAHQSVWGSCQSETNQLDTKF